VALFSENLQRLQDLETRYREELEDYQHEVSRYRRLLEENPKDPSLPGLYEQVESKNKRAEETYRTLEELRRSLSPGAGASGSLG
jgi:septation ring formation regulator EzrA